MNTTELVVEIGPGKNSGPYGPELFFQVLFQLLVKNLFMLSVRISSYGCTREVWRARKMHKSSSRRSREQL